MYKYYNKLRKSIDKLGADVPDILKNSYEDTMGAFLNRFLRRIKAWKTPIIVGIVVSSIIGAIGIALIASAVALVFATPLLLLSIILGSLGLGVSAISVCVFLLTNNFISYYKLGKNIGRLEERSKEMLQKFPQYKTKVLEILHGNGMATPKTAGMAKTAFKTFKEKNLDNQQINLFLLEATDIFNNASDSSTPYKTNNIKNIINTSSDTSDTSNDNNNYKPQKYKPINSKTPPPGNILDPEHIIIPSNVEDKSSDSNNNEELENLIK